MTLTARRPGQAAPSEAGDTFDDAFKAMLRAWHDYEVLRGIGAPRDTVAAAHGALQRAKVEVARRRSNPQ
jgi:hypothetical protein